MPKGFPVSEAELTYDGSASFSWPIPPEQFVHQMTEHWTANIGNYHNAALQDMWRQLCEVFNQKISETNSALHDRWHTLPLPTGTGKTEGLLVYCWMLAQRYVITEQPGVLIVTRLQKEADGLAMKLNTLFGSVIAITDHSGSPSHDPSAMAYMPVVIIAHEGYKISVKEARRGDFGRWSRHNTFGNQFGVRRLLVIDEAIDLINHHVINSKLLHRIQAVLAAVPEIRDQLSPTKNILAGDQPVSVCEYVDMLADWLSERSLHPQTEGILKYSPASPGPNMSMPFDGLRHAFRNVKYEQLLSDYRDLQRRRDIKAEFDEYINALESLIFANVVAFRRHRDSNCLVTSELLRLPKSQGCVMLDATSQINVLNYLDVQVTEHMRLRHPRNYSTVTVYVSRDYYPGRHSMVKNAESDSREILGNLDARLDRSRSALIVCHKQNRASFEAVETGFTKEIATWGAIAGRNDWQDFDCVAICGLQYRNELFRDGFFLTLQGPDESSWTHDPEEVGGLPIEQHHEQILRDIQLSPVIADVIQAINRVRCRKFVDAAGNCKETDVFILLRHGDEGDAIVSALMREMPNARIATWEISAELRSVRLSPTESDLLAWAESVSPGKYGSQDVVKAKSIRSGTLRQTLNRRCGPNSDLRTALLERGISVSKLSTGRWCFEKRSQ